MAAQRWRRMRARGLQEQEHEQEKEDGTTGRDGAGRRPRVLPPPRHTAHSGRAEARPSEAVGASLFRGAGFWEVTPPSRQGKGGASTNEIRGYNGHAAYRSKSTSKRKRTAPRHAKTVVTAPARRGKRQADWWRRRSPSAWQETRCRGWESRHWSRRCWFRGRWRAATGWSYSARSST